MQGIDAVVNFDVPLILRIIHRIGALDAQEAQVKRLRLGSDEIVLAREIEYFTKSLIAMWISQF